MKEENIPNPNMEFEIKETFNFFNNINFHIETIKQNHPEIIVPSYSKTQYKFYDWELSRRTPPKNCLPQA